MDTFPDYQWNVRFVLWMLFKPLRAVNASNDGNLLPDLLFFETTCKQNLKPFRVCSAVGAGLCHRGFWPSFANSPTPDSGRVNVCVWEQWQLETGPSYDTETAASCFNINQLVLSLWSCFNSDTMRICCHDWKGFEAVRVQTAEEASFQRCCPLILVPQLGHRFISSDSFRSLLCSAMWAIEAGVNRMLIVCVDTLSYSTDIGCRSVQPHSDADGERIDGILQGNTVVSNGLLEIAFTCTEVKADSSAHWKRKGRWPRLGQTCWWLRLIWLMLKWCFRLNTSGLLVWRMQSWPLSCRTFKNDCSEKCWLDNGSIYSYIKV